MDPSITLDPPPDGQQPKQVFYLPTTPSPTKSPLGMPPKFLFRTSPIKLPVKSPPYIGSGRSPGKMFALSVPRARYIPKFDALPVASPVRSPLVESGSFEEGSLPPAYNPASPVERAERPIVSNETNNPVSPKQHLSASNNPSSSPPSMTISPASFYNRNSKVKSLPSPSNPPATKIRLTTSSSNSPKSSPILGAPSPPKLRIKIVNPSFNNTSTIQTSSSKNTLDIETDEMARTRSTKRKFEATEVEGQTKSNTLEPLIKKRMGVQQARTRLPSTKRDFVKIEEDHALHNTLESLIKKNALVRAEPSVLPTTTKRGKTWVQFEKEAIKASLERGPIVPHCCKPHPVKYNHGHIQVENESGDEDEIETEYEGRPRGRAPKNPKDIPFHLQEFFAPVASLEDHFRAAHFPPGWTNVAFAKRSHVEKAATTAVANALSGIHGNDPAYIHGDMKVDINDFLTKSSKETLYRMAGPDAHLKREEVRKWSAEDKKGLERLLELVKEKLRLAEEKEVKVKAEKESVKY